MKPALLLFLLPVLAAGAERIEFSTLSGFDYEVGMELPEKVRKLDGKTIQVSGFIRTEDSSTEDISVFWLVDQNCDCEGAPRINEMILCTMPEGRTIHNDDAPIEVRGTFTAREEKEDGYVLSLYRMEVHSVQ